MQLRVDNCAYCQAIDVHQSSAKSCTHHESSKHARPNHASHSLQVCCRMVLINYMVLYMSVYTSSLCVMLWVSGSMDSHELVMVEPQFNQNANWRSQYL